MDWLTEPDFAVMVVVPAPTLVASPWLPAVLLMVATVGVEELQITEVVRSCVLPSVKVPVPANCWVVPCTIVALAGVTTSETRVAAVTVRVVDPLTPLEAAVIVVVPIALLVASPVVLMVATVVCEELQVTEVVRSCVLPSVKVPVAVNCCLVPSAMEGLAGVTVSDTRAADVTLSDVDRLTEPEVAVIVVVPTLALVARPWLPAVLLMTATAVFAELQVTVVVRSCVLPSVKVPVAVNG